MDAATREHVAELFEYHATDGVLNERAFGQLLQEGLAYSFLKETGFPSKQVKGDLRCLCARQSLPGSPLLQASMLVLIESISGIGSSLFRRSFLFFDYANEGKVSLEQLQAGISQFLMGGCRAFGC